MKKNVYNERINFIEAIKSRKIKPNSNEKVNVTLNKDILYVQFAGDFDVAKECYLVAYDKKNETVIDIDKVKHIKNEAYIEFSNKLFWEKFRKRENFKYARLCIAMYFENKYSYFYLSNNNDVEEYDESNSYVGVIDEEKGKDARKLMLYYSMAGQLSVKFLKEEEYYKKVANCSIESIVGEDDVIRIVVDGFHIKGKETRVAWVSKTSNKIVENILVSVNEIKVVGPTRQKITIEMNLNEMVFIEPDSYYMVCIVGEYVFDVNFSGEQEKIDNNTCDILNRIYDVGARKTNQAVFAIDCNGRLDLQIAKKIYPYMFSLVVGVYNTEMYLDEAFGSILEQNTEVLNKYLIGNEADDYGKRVFKDIYEVIMVNDGSTDSSVAICQKYADEHKNFVLLNFEKNSGVSYARNSGIDVSQGKYLNFMDSDDRISDNMLAETFLFFEEHYDEMETLAVPSYFFDAADGEHWLNDKFKKGNRIIDLWKESESSLVFVNATVYKGDRIREKEVVFDTELLSSEDIKFNYQLLMKYGAKIGVLDNCIYWYRRRSGGELSAVQTSKMTESYYTTYMDNFVGCLIQESKNRFGCVVKYVQHVIMQQFQWRLIEDAEGCLGIGVLGKEKYDTYKRQILDVISEIDDDVIMAQNKLFIEHKAFLLTKKHKEKPRQEFYHNDAILYLGNTLLTSLSKLKTQFDFIKIEDGILKLEGSMNFLNIEGHRTPEIFLRCGEKYIKCKNVVRQNERWSLGEIIMITEGFYGEINLSDVEQCEVEIGYRLDERNIIKKNIKFSRRAPLNITYKNAYYADEKWVVKYSSGRFILENIDKKICQGDRLEYEEMFLAEVVKKSGREIGIEKAIQIRKQYMNWKMLNFGKRKPIWLISDRNDQADDNGEVFFWYMLENHSEDVECYFVIDKNSKDYDRLKKSNRVIIYNSDEHKLMHLMADVIISSQGNEYITDPFYVEGLKDVFRDITYRHKYIFLQHGVIKDDLSKWLNRYEKNIDGFVTSAMPEYRSILEGNYCYSEKEVWLTGLPRYDKLYHNEKKVITVMPTWRKYILLEDKDVPGKFHLSQGFEKTKFYEYYNGLFHDERLAEAMEKYDYQMVIKMHPLMEECREKFELDDRVKFCSSDMRYVDLFAESELLVTDYSSTAMDFAYLNKPVIYAQFDEKEFFAGEHSYEKGYFNYEKDGFGEVVYNLDSCVEQMIRYMETGCKLQEQYAQRIKDFFVYQDRDNCERVYKKIKEISIN